MVSLSNCLYSADLAANCVVERTVSPRLLLRRRRMSVSIFGTLGVRERKRERKRERGRNRERKRERERERERV